jgi:AraC family transcriptional regulator, transcriptional activator of pobA
MSVVAGNTVRASVQIWRRERGGPLIFPSMPVQRHTLVVVDGPECTRVTASGEAIGHTPGDVYLFPPGARVDSRSLGTATYWIVSFARYPIAHCLTARPRGLPATVLGSADGIRRFYAEPAQVERLVTVIQMLREELETDVAVDQSAVPPLLSLMLTETARLTSVCAPRVPPDAAARQRLVREVFDVIERRYRQPIGLSDVAKAVGRSAAHLTHTIRAETGRTVLQWIIERRMREAERLLLDTDEPLQAIAAAVGYDSAGYFIRQFARRHALSPGVWRGVRRAELAERAELVEREAAARFAVSA